MEDNKKITRRVYEELFSKGDLGVADQVFAAEFVSHDPNLPKEVRGPEETKEVVRMYRTAFPDLQFTVEDQFAEGDCVVTRFTARGTQRGELFGMPASGKRATTTGITIDKFANDRIIESWVSYDLFGLMRQLGFAAPQPGAPEAREQPAQQRH